MRPDFIARLSHPSGYCSGVLVNPTTVLTCAHFFRDVDRLVNVDVAGTRRRVKDVEVVSGTDIAIADVARVRIPEGADFPTLGRAPQRFSATATFGYGGKLRHPAARDGYFLTALPFAFSRNLRTRVQPAGAIFNVTPAVKGDSGGPVMAHGEVFAVQSLILDPFGVNLGLATVSLFDERVHAAVDKRTN
ncbi:Trypsin-like peptidase domain-containing protein [Corynebacterium mycetoides]|uniref:Trypsin-like peptidase domain-containing protein n=1 Tax=Corynebacterium mycetoides TaxID=38302 RepID=A0A1G9MC87_9CORY|nr:serine protease [Corynebacterium mycetoides]SDL71295.1 Trypsin-like peptidase domain-containing protein [Corynebacterium mycetoides]